MDLNNNIGNNPLISKSQNMQNNGGGGNTGFFNRRRNKKQNNDENIIDETSIFKSDLNLNDVSKLFNDLDDHNIFGK